VAMRREQVDLQRAGFAKLDSPLSDKTAS